MRATAVENAQAIRRRLARLNAAIQAIRALFPTRREQAEVTAILDQPDTRAAHE